MRRVRWMQKLSVMASVAGIVGMVGMEARADISSTNPAAILVFPKIVVDGSRGIDTFVQISNVADQPVNVRCFYVNANGRCSSAPFQVCNPYGENTCSTGGVCVPGWQETDFAFRLTSKQPIFWRVSQGLPDLPLANRPGPKGEFNTGSIPPSPDDPMIGELKCVQVGDDELPVDMNSLIGEAGIVERNDTRIYNAYGIQAIEGANNRDNTLVLGQEYNGCPNLLLVNHFFDGVSLAGVLPGGGTVTTDLTLVPCSQDFNFQAPRSVVAQYLVFNEFEQRFSTSRSVTCFQEIALSDIDTRPGAGDDVFSIFNAAVQGTFTGQTIIRGVQTSDPVRGTGLLAITEEFRGGGSDANVVHQRGVRTQADVILLPAAQPSGL
ncbi:MAG: hypothetical protein KatS3mg077_1174 [Candidatus Binatia bacterium]|nr:MAG: hypothetical protein KatS3mg077_1174 [Candidatus Binatia bacterium]